ncbi:MAG: O-antigen ligase family protein [bacterium]|nr:O-antigen ligase family protein [bacterium]
MRDENNSLTTRYSAFSKDIATDKGLWFIIYFATVLAYLLLNQGGSIDLNRAPQWAFRAFAFGGFILFSILDPKRIRGGLRVINFRSVLPIALFIQMVVSNIVTLRPFETAEETMNILSYAAIALLVYVYIDSLKRLRQLIEIILVAGFLIAFHGLFIFYGALWSRGETTPLSSLFYWHNPCAGFLLLIWPVMLAQFYSLRRGLQAFFILYFFYFTFTAFGLTLSRGGWLSGLIPFFAIPFILSRKKTMVSWRPILLIVLYFFSAIPFVLHYRGRFFQPILDRFNQLRLDDYSVIGRLEFWNISWRVFLEHPIFGIGFNSFGYYYVHYQTNPQYYTKDPHNLYLQFLVEGGIFGGAVIIAVLAIVYKLIVKSLRESNGKMLTIYRVGLLGGIVGELAHNALDFDWTFPVIPMLIIVQIAMVARTFTYRKIEQELTVDQWEPDESTSAENPESQIDTISKPARGWFLPSLRLWQIVAALFFIVNVFGFVSMNLYEKGKNMIENQSALAQTRADSEMSQLQKEAMRESTQEVPTFSEAFSSARSDIVQEGMKYWEKSLIYNPWNWYPLKDLLSAHFFGSQDLINSGNSDRVQPIIVAGLEYGKRLLKITPYRPASYYYVGQIEILAGRLWGDDNLKQDGIEKALHAIELDPKNIPRYYLGIAQYYRDEGNLDEALRYIGTMEELFVPLFPGTDDIDFGALKGKSLARNDWIDICETIREAWWLKADMFIERGKLSDALVPLYNGLNTPLGGGEMAAANLDLGLLQAPFALRLAEIESELGMWEEAYLHANQVIDILTEKDLLGTGQSGHAYDLMYAAQSHLTHMSENQNPEIPEIESPSEPPANP